MNINSRRQSQFELFPSTPGSTPETGKKARFIKDLTLSLENIIVLCIILVMVMVLFFSFGVEKGKRIAMAPEGPHPGDTLGALEERDEKEPLGSLESSAPEEQAVLPTDTSLEDVTEEGDRQIQPPLEINDEQKNLFTIQVASFKLRKNAQTEANRLKDIGHEDAFVIPKGSYSIVCIGKFSRKDEAKKFSNRLKGRYNDCLVRSL